MEKWINIKEYPNYWINSYGKIINAKGEQLSYEISNNGYARVSLYNENGKKRFLVHRLVAKVFLSTYSDNLQVNHKDGNKQNNNVDNLEMVTCSENLLHAYKTNLKKQYTKEDHANHILTYEAVKYIRANYIPYDKEYGQTALALKFNVSRSTIEKVVHGETWNNEEEH